MTSKERVKAVFEHKIPDKVPVFEQLVVSRVAAQILGRHAYTGGGEFAKESLDALIEGKRDWLVRRSIEDTIELYQRLDMDIVSVSLVAKKGGIGSLPKKLDEYTYRFEDSTDRSRYAIQKFSPLSGEFFTVFDNLSCQDVENLESLKQELQEGLKKEIVFDPSEWEAVDEVVKRMF